MGMNAQQKLMLNALDDDEQEDKKVNYSTMDMPDEDRAKHEVVAPDSIVKLEEQTDYALYRVVLLKKGMQWFKKICREFRYSVRDFEYKDQQIQAENADTIK